MTFSFDISGGSTTLSPIKLLLKNLKPWGPAHREIGHIVEQNWQIFLAFDMLTCTFDSNLRNKIAYV